MKRRTFIKTGGLAAAGALAAPYILPSGRLFASTGGVPIANHVVLVMFAGGVRWQESVGQTYLAESQKPYASTPQAQLELDFEGNVMPNMFDGIAPAGKIIYGKKSKPDEPFSTLLTTPLAKQGMLFKETYSAHPGHYGGLNVQLQGNAATGQGLRKRPVLPTIFEYLRRHGGPTDFPASKIWMVGNSLGNSVPLLNHSDHVDYGSQFGANMFIPSVTFGADGVKHLKNAKVYHPQEELEPIHEMKYFLDNTFKNIGNSLPNIGNTTDERDQIQLFMKNIFDRQAGSGPPISFPTGISSSDRNGDVNVISYACEIMREFSPKLTVVNLSSVDTAHANFTGYLEALHRADYAVGHMWDFINNDPALTSTMKDDTVILVVPECGRNLQPNPIQDPDNLFYGYDHSDANTRRVFTIMTGKGIAQNQVYTDAGKTAPGELATKSKPETADIAMTIAEILGIKQDVINAGLTDTPNSLFDRI